MPFSKTENACNTTRPLINHSELQVLTTSLVTENLQSKDNSKVDHVEYRVYNYQTYKNGMVDRGDGWGMKDLLILSILVWTAWTQQFWTTCKSFKYDGMLFWDKQAMIMLIWMLSFLVCMNRKCNTVLYESIVPLPDLGIQLSVTEGLSLPWCSTPHKRILFPLSTSYTFIPLSDISTVILNQALSRFSVRYYLGIVKRDGKGVIVGFDNIRPRFEVLREVYHGIREIMFDEFDDKVD